jgi:hypothetical protein
MPLLRKAILVPCPLASLLRERRIEGTGLAVGLEDDILYSMAQLAGYQRNDAITLWHGEPGDKVGKIGAFFRSTQSGPYINNSLDERGPLYYLRYMIIISLLLHLIISLLLHSLSSHPSS